MDEATTAEPTTEGRPEARPQPWRRVRFWVAGVFILLFLPSLATQTASALLIIVTVLALYWKWDAIAAWNRKRVITDDGRPSGRTRSNGGPSVSSGSYVGQTLVPGETIQYRARLSRWVLLSGLIVFGVIAYLTTEMVVTNRRVIVKRGWIARRTIELRLSKVESAQVRQGIFGRMLGYGSVSVIGTGGTRETFGFVADPLGFRRAVTEALDIHEGTHH
jgi:hypothetical protein